MMNKKHIGLFVGLLTIQTAFAEQENWYTMDAELSHGQLTLSNFKQSDLQELFSPSELTIVGVNDKTSSEYFILTEKFYSPLKDTQSEIKWQNDQNLSMTISSADNQVITTRVANIAIKNLSAEPVNTDGEMLLKAFYYSNSDLTPPKFPQGAKCLQVKSYVNSNDTFIFDRNSKPISKIKNIQQWLKDQNKEYKSKIISSEQGVWHNIPWAMVTFKGYQDVVYHSGAVQLDNYTVHTEYQNKGLEITAYKDKCKAYNSIASDFLKEKF